MFATKKSKRDFVCSIPVIILAVTVLLIHANAICAQDHDLVDTAYPRLAILHVHKPTYALATQTWDGGGTTNNWSEAANWTNDTLPTAAVFDATSTKNAIIDISIDISGIQIMSGYTGTISLADGVNATIGNTSVMSGGTFTAGSGMLIFGSPAVGGGLNLSGGTFNAGSGQLLFRNSFNQTGGTFNGSSGDVSGCFDLSGGTFVAPSANLTTSCQGGRFKPTTFFHNNGAFIFTGGNANIEVNTTLELNNLTLNKNEGGVLNILEAGRTIRVAGTLSLIEGRLAGAQFNAEGAVSIAPNYGSADSSVGGSGTIVFKDIAGVRNITWPSTASLPHIRIEDDGVTLTLSGSGPARSGGITMLTGAIQGGSTDMEIGHGASTGHALDESGGTFNLGDGDLLLATGAFRITGGTFTMGSGNMTFPCFLSVTIAGGTFNASSGTTTMCSTGDFNGNFTQTAGVFNGGSGTLDINHNFTLSGGTFNASSATTLFGFVFTHSAGTFNHGNGTVFFDSTHGGYSINNPGTENFHNLTLNPAGSLGLAGDNWIANGTLRLMNGVIDGGILQAKGDMIVENTSDGGTSQIVFNGTGNQIYTNNGGPNTTGAWTVNKAGGMLTAATDMILGTTQALNVTAGTLYLAEGSDLTAGAITIGTNGILASDSVATAIITLGAAATNNGRLDLQGGGSTCPQLPPDPIRLRSSLDGTQRAWSGSGVFNLNDVDVKDMGGTSNTTPAITVFNGTNSGNNRANWTFSDACGAANRLGFVTQPSHTTAGQTITPSVQVAVQDQFGNTVTTATNSITLAIFDNPGSGTLSGTLTRSAVNGVATFDNLSINRSANDYTLRATAIGLAAATSNPFNVQAGPAVEMIFLVQPTDTNATEPITPTVKVAIRDALGNTVDSSAQVRMSLAFAPNPIARLGGAVTVNAVSGIATFDPLIIGLPGDGYILAANSDGLSTKTSDPFDIIRPILMVTNTNDSGPGSLRQAILDAHFLPGEDRINFNIPGAPPFVIAPLTPLPPIAWPTILDATSQPGYAGTPVIELTGTNIPPGSLNRYGFWVTGTGATIKGFAINGFLSGIVFAQFSASNVIHGNYIGTDITGTQAKPNWRGIVSEGSSSTIGGSGAGEGNLISGNTTAGIQQYTSIDSYLVSIKGNRIGTAANGTTPLPNGTCGIEMYNPGVIGGDLASDANVIAFNGGCGIRSILFNTAVLIRRNSIHSNGDLGIDVGTWGLTPNRNDSMLTEAQNFPVLDFATSSGGNTTIRGTLSSRVGVPSDFHIDFYSSDVCDPSGHGEGRTYLGTTNVSTDASGIVQFTANLPVAVPAGHQVVATASLGTFKTSEFSACRTVAPSVVSISGRVTDTGGSALANTVVRLTGARFGVVNTNSNGEYTFSNLPVDLNYAVTPSRVNYDFTPPSRTYTNIPGNQSNQNFVGTKTRYTISGRLLKNSVWGSEPVPLAGVRVALSGTVARAVTADGAYSFNDLPPGKYSITATRDGNTFTPPTANVVVTNADQTVNFNAAAIASLEGRILNENSGSIDSIYADGTGWGLVPETWNSEGATLSRDGRKIAYTKRNGTTGGRGLYTANGDGSGVVQLIAGSDTMDNFDPEWSPDGTTIVFVQISAGRRAIRHRGPDGRVTSIPLSSLVANYDSPTWLSNSRIAFSATPPGSGIPDIYAVNLDGSGIARLTVAVDLNGSTVPSASPNGTKIAFRRRTTGLAGGALVVMNANGTAPTQIRNDAISTKPAWSPDGTLIAYRQAIIASTTEPLVAVNSMNGSQPRQIHNRRARSISWGPGYEFATPMGSNVVVDSGGARVTFSSVVTSTGTTTFATLGTVGLPALGSLGSYVGHPVYDIGTTAAYSAPVTVCLRVPPTYSITQAGFDRWFLFHIESGAWVNRTSSRSFATRTICAQTTTVGTFAIVHSSAGASSGVEEPSISGSVIDPDGNPLSNVVIRLSGTGEHLTQTDNLGRFTFVGLVNGGNYVVEPYLVGYVFAEPSNTFVNLSGENEVAFVGTETVFSASGRITHPDGSAAVSVPVTVDGSADLITFTDNNGDYAFTDLLPANGSYRVTPHGTGFFGPRSTVIDALTSDASGVDFVHYANAPEFVTVTGRVMSADGFAIPLARVTMIGPGGEAMSSLSNPFGYYIFTDVRPGDVYSIGVKKKESEFSTSPYSIYVTSAMSNVDFISDP